MNIEILQHDGNANGDCWTDSDGEPLPAGIYYWNCQPGCMPDGDPVGPFATEQAAINDAFGDIMPAGYFTPKLTENGYICEYENGIDYAGPCATPTQAYLAAVSLSEC